MEPTLTYIDARLSGRQFYALTHVSLCISALAVFIQFSVGPSLITAIVATCCLLAQVTLIAVFQRRLFYLSFLVSFAYVGATASCILIESGAYLGESMQTGFVTGATARHALLCMLFLYGCSLTFAIDDKRTENVLMSARPSADIVKLSFNFLLVAILAYFSYVLLRYGSPLTLGVGKFSYFNHHAPELAKRLVSYVPQLNFLLGIQYALSRESGPLKRSILMAIFLLSLIILALLGYKFSMLFLATFFFFTPLIIFLESNSWNRISIWRFTLLFLAFMLFSLPLILLHYMLSSGDLASALEQLRDRLALQAQIWWVADHALISWEPREFQEFLRLATRSDGINGMTYMMSEVLPRETLNFYLEVGVVLSMGFPAVVLVLAGWPLGSFLVLICGIIFGWASKIFLFGILSRNLIFAFIAMKLYLGAYVAFVPGEVDILFFWRYLLYVFFVVYIIVLYRTNSKRMLRLLEGNWLSRYQPNSTRRL